MRAGSAAAAFNPSSHTPRIQSWFRKKFKWIFFFGAFLEPVRNDALPILRVQAKGCTRSALGATAVEGVRHVESSASDGSSRNAIKTTTVPLTLFEDAITRIRIDLSTASTIRLSSASTLPGLPIHRARGKMPDQLYWFAKDVGVRALQGVRSIASIQRTGSFKQEILMALDPVRLHAVGLASSTSIGGCAALCRLRPRRDQRQ
jgi:hypothetical protein